ncbi:hypothetical protein ACOTWR_11865 [Aliarcobacter butzleri]|uniref:hypothetical protein n=1 Tax=Aliarcobacter butzleri TaxID=28197 RepID=UPI0021B2A9D8|nr:hypothetical protein [Aliarcobacter butzleri]MCT7564580.1 hypothetical protein [Aliarcobacter butzleri]MCT7578604.1 hypothetical protein [Aliarcobacter butzleri]MCT7647544.1 hypothetical protein [Aliarcobacter butzleri]
MFNINNGGLKIVKKRQEIVHEINFKSAFSKEDKNIIKEYVKNILQTDYKEKCINILKQQNGLVLFFGNNKRFICEIYLSEIRALIDN